MFHGTLAIGELNTRSTGERLQFRVIVQPARPSNNSPQISVSVRRIERPQGFPVALLARDGCRATKPPRELPGDYQRAIAVDLASPRRTRGTHARYSTEFDADLGQHRGRLVDQHDGISDPAPAAGNDDSDPERDEAQAGEEEASEEVQERVKVYHAPHPGKPTEHHHSRGATILA
jgi:hypothetical protein